MQFTCSVFMNGLDIIKLGIKAYLNFLPTFFFLQSFESRLEGGRILIEVEEYEVLQLFYLFYFLLFLFGL